MVHIVADAAIPFLGEALEGAARVTYIPGKQITREHLLDADALLVRTRTRCDEELLKGTSVKFIASATIGSDHIDTGYCASQGILWTAAPGCNAGAVRQYIASSLAFIVQKQKTGFDKICLGVVGAGNIGSRVIQMAKALGIKTLVNDPPREAAEGQAGFTALEILLSESDIVSLHVPLTRDGAHKTHHLAGKAFFERMKPGAWFINTSRGEVADTGAILHAIEKKKTGGCIIDVWETEPGISQGLVNAASLATPHIAGYSVEGKANGSAMGVQAISRFFGLGLDTWFPAAMIPPEEPLIEINDRVIAPESLFARTIWHTYNIAGDSARLKRGIHHFEILRENYVYRREPGAFKVKLTSAIARHRRMLESIGFGIDSA
jgi:erythronate-4-phosphate dehydrogenase